MNRRLEKISNPLSGKIRLAGSKSISNRLLIIQALAKDDMHLHGLANADDTKVLQQALSANEYTYDVHHAGTSYRFLCSYLCLQDGVQILTGSDRMKERPIGPLVDALRTLGADITYLEEEGYPPLKIGEANWKKAVETLTIDASISSQFISSLLLIAPHIPGGLQLRLEGNLVSRPYLEMTLNLMTDFGITYSWEDDMINISEQEYTAKDYEVEADWSAASYYFGLAALVPGSEIQLSGLHQNSIQGDQSIVEIMKSLGVESAFKNGVWHLKHIGNHQNEIEQDFLLQPDLAQTVSVVCAGLGVTALFSGLQTLKVKETDRILALQNELLKVQVYLSKLPRKFSKNPSKEYYLQEGKASSEEIPIFPTYKDHRMAMAFACLSAIMPVEIEEADVVSKSYPDFWEDYDSLTSADADFG